MSINSLQLAGQEIVREILALVYARPKGHYTAALDIEVVDADNIHIDNLTVTSVESEDPSDLPFLPLPEAK